MLNIDKNNQRVWYNKIPLNLSHKEYQTLLLLAENVGQTVTRDTIVQRAWETQYKSDAVVTQLISTLKAKLKQSNTDNRDPNT